MFGFNTTRSIKKLGTPKRRSARRSNFQMETLEDRKLMTVTSMTVDAAGLLSIKCDDGVDNITVYQSGINTAVKSVSPTGAVTISNMGTKVKSLDIRTYGGADTVTNNTNLLANIYGGMANDTLNGGTVRDNLHGEDGDDTLRGNGGGDYLYGGNNNDTLWGNAGADSLYGNAGNDVMLGGGGEDTIKDESGVNSLYGDDAFGASIVDGEAAGNDFLVGGKDVDNIFGGYGDDSLMGGTGDDYLYGQDGNDRLYGNGGYDTLWGMNNDDFLDAGSTGESYNGGDGNDFHAYRTVVNGATTDDIAQGNSESCFIVAAMGAAASRGVDMASRITYEGGGNYRVALFKPTGTGSYTPVNVHVFFDGQMKTTDSPAHYRGQEGESWTVIMTRALATLLGVNLATTYGGDSGDVLAAIMGRPKNTSSWTDNSGYVSPYYRDSLLDYLYNVGNSAPTIVASRGTAGELASNRIVPNHAYMVKSVIITGYTYSPQTYQYVPQYSVVLANPWGYDMDAKRINSGTGAASGDNNDGVIVLTGAEFKRNFRAILFA